MTVSTMGSESLPVLVRVVCVATYHDETFGRKVAGWRPPGTQNAKPSLPSGYLKAGEDLRQAASRVFRELANMPDYANRLSMWHVWTSRATAAGELLVFVRRKSIFSCTLVPSLWLNGTSVVPVSVDTELDLPEMSDGIKACFRSAALSNRDNPENPDLDANEEFEDQQERGRQAEQVGEAQRQTDRAAVAGTTP